MENEIVAHHPGAVEAVEVAAGDQVSVGQALVRLGPTRPITRSGWAAWPRRRGRLGPTVDAWNPLAPPSSPGPPAASASRSPASSPAAAGTSSSTPATRARSGRPTRRFAGSGPHGRCPRRRRRPRHRRALVDAARELGGLDLLVNNASALGPSPMPPLAELDPADLEAILRTNTRRAARPRPAGASAARGARRPDPEHHLRRRGRGLRGMGWLRRLEGRARAALERARRRAARPARLLGRPRRHAHADAPGRVPGRGHLRPPAARGERARASSR